MRPSLDCHHVGCEIGTCRCRRLGQFNANNFTFTRLTQVLRYLLKYLVLDEALSDELVGSL